MSLTAREIAEVVGELQPLVGGFVQKIHVPEPRTVVLELRQPGASHLIVLCAELGRTRLHEAESRPPSPDSPLPFQGLLRADVLGLALDSIEALPGERAARLTFRGKDRRVTLMAELTGRHGNLFLVGEDGRVRGSAVPNLSERRDNRAGQPYVPPFARAAPPAGDEKSRFAGASGGDFPISRAIEQTYAVRERADFASQKRQSLLAGLKSKRTRLARTIEKVRGDVARAGKAEEHRRRGDLLKSNLGQLRRGLPSIRLVEYTETGPVEVELQLDPARTPKENMEREYHQYRRLLSGQGRAAQRLAQLESELAHLETQTLRVESMSEEDLLATPSGAPTAPVVPGRKKAGPALPFREYLSGSGQRIRVGKGAKENDALTFRHSKGNDVWLHARGVAGAHVVIPLSRDEQLKDETLRDAALLAAHASEAKGRDTADVAWTRVKYVHKVKGAPGAVTYSQDKTVLVKPDPERVTRLLQTAAVDGG